MSRPRIDPQAYASAIGRPTPVVTRDSAPSRHDRHRQHAHSPSELLAPVGDVGRGSDYFAAQCASPDRLRRRYSERTVAVPKPVVGFVDRGLCVCQPGVIAAMSSPIACRSAGSKSESRSPKGAPPDVKPTAQISSPPHSTQPSSAKRCTSVRSASLPSWRRPAFRDPRRRLDCTGDPDDLRAEPFRFVTVPTLARCPEEESRLPAGSVEVRTRSGEEGWGTLLVTTFAVRVGLLAIGRSSEYGGSWTGCPIAVMGRCSQRRRLLAALAPSCVDALLRQGAPVISKPTWQ
jgi:hypothetical protein